MSSPKSIKALERLGRDVRGARLRRGMAVSDLAIRANTSASTIARLEKGDPGVAIGTLADILVALGIVERLLELFDLKHDELGLAMVAERLPQRGRSSSAALKRIGKAENTPALRGNDDIDPDGVSF